MKVTINIINKPDSFDTSVKYWKLTLQQQQK